MENNTYKRFQNRDIQSVQRLSDIDLFENLIGLNKPWDAYEQQTIATDIAPIDYIKRNESDVYFSYVRGKHFSIEDIFDDQVTSDESLIYYQMVQMMNTGSTEKYEVNNDNVSFESEEIDIIAVSRNYYKDMLNRSFMGIIINVDSNNSPNTSYGSGTNDVALFTGSKVRSSDIGRRVYLYPSTNGDSNLYDPNTQELTVRTDNDLDLSSPYGEIHIDSGIIVLFVDKLKQSYTNLTDTSLLHYLEALVGRSKIQLNSTIYQSYMHNDEFNHSTNRTFYREDNPDVIKPHFRNNPLTYPTTIGLFNDQNELIASGRFSKLFQKNIRKAVVVKSELSY